MGLLVGSEFLGQLDNKLKEGLQDISSPIDPPAQGHFIWIGYEGALPTGAV